MAKAVKNEKGVSLVLSKEEAEKLGFKENAEYELAQATQGVFVLLEKAVDKPVPPIKKQVAQQPAQKRLPIEEYRLLRKLDKIKYEQRIPYRVHKFLTKEEKDLLEQMKKKGLVSLYTGGKYAKTGVYTIPNEIYAIIKGNKPRQELPSEPEKLSEKKNLSWEEHLEKYGYLIVENENDAQRISGKLEKAIKKGDILGTRGFDKKFYIADRAFYGEWNNKITPLITGKEKRVPEICNAINMSEVACRVALELMRDQGEIIEKKRGFYTAI